MNESVSPSENLARYIVSSRWIRKSDQSVKPDAFIPYPNLELSVTRHLHPQNIDLWTIGERVACCRERMLYGRADVEANDVFDQNLDIIPDPIQPDNSSHPDYNPNHANVIDWPKAKDEQKMIALQIAQNSHFISKG